MGTRMQYPTTNRIGATVTPPRHRSAYPTAKATAASPHHKLDRDAVVPDPFVPVIDGGV